MHNPSFNLFQSISWSLHGHTLVQDATMVLLPNDNLYCTVLEKCGLEPDSAPLEQLGTGTVDWERVFQDPKVISKKDLTPAIRSLAMWGEGHNLKRTIGSPGKVPKCIEDNARITPTE